MSILSKSKVNILNLCILTLVLLSSAITITIKAEDLTSVLINPSTLSVSPGDTFTIDVYCVPRQEIKAFEFKLSFDSSLVQANEVVEGNIFDGHYTFFNAGIIDNTAGTIVNIFNLIIGLESVSDPGTFVSISFTALSNPGTSIIDIYDAGVTNESGYISIVVNDGEVTILDSNRPPTISGAAPNNESTDISVSTSSLSVTINDPDGDSYNWTIETSPDVGGNFGNGASNGSKSCIISNLIYSTTYTWYVNATDGEKWSREFFSFTTESEPATNNEPAFSSPSPSNGSADVSISTSSIFITIQDSDSDTFNWSIETSPDVGDNSGNGESDGTKTCTISGMSYSTSYSWFVNATDGEHWTREFFTFITEAEPGYLTADPGGGGSIPPAPPADGGTVNRPPETPLKPSGPTSIEMGIEYSYSSSTYDPDGDQIRYQFDWGDGNISEWSEFISSNISVSMTHSWNSISTFHIQIIAQDENSTNSSWSSPLDITVSQIEVGEEYPLADINVSNNKSTNLTILFDASGSYDIDGVIISYDWDFGDGETGSGISTTHTYQGPGQYDVTLEVTDDDGKKFSKSIQIIIYPVGEETQSEEKVVLFPFDIGSIIIGIAVIFSISIIIVFRNNVLSFITEYRAYRFSSHKISDKKDRIEQLDKKIEDLKMRQGTIDYETLPEFNIEEHYNQILEKNVDSEIRSNYIEKVEKNVDSEIRSNYIEKKSPIYNPPKEKLDEDHRSTIEKKIDDLILSKEKER